MSADRHLNELRARRGNGNSARADTIPGSAAVPSRVESPSVHHRQRGRTYSGGREAGSVRRPTLRESTRRIRHRGGTRRRRPLRRTGPHLMRVRATSSADRESHSPPVATSHHDLDSVAVRVRWQQPTCLRREPVVVHSLHCRIARTSGHHRRSSRCHHRCPPARGHYPAGLLRCPTRGGGRCHPWHETSGTRRRGERGGDPRQSTLFSSHAERTRRLSGAGPGRSRSTRLRPC